MSVHIEHEPRQRYIPWVRVADRDEWLRMHVQLIDRLRSEFGDRLCTRTVERWARAGATDFPCLWHYELVPSFDGNTTRLQYFFVFPGDARFLLGS